MLWNYDYVDCFVRVTRATSYLRHVFQHLCYELLSLPWDTEISDIDLFSAQVMSVVFRQYKRLSLISNIIYVLKYETRFLLASVLLTYCQSYGPGFVSIFKEFVLCRCHCVDLSALHYWLWVVVTLNTQPRHSILYQHSILHCLDIINWHFDIGTTQCRQP